MSALELTATDIEKGTSLGKYEILRKLATGGMAEIYLARVRGIVGFEKLVVLKRILPNVAEDPSFVQMFLDEARLAATLQHPNIADVYDVGNEGKTYFFTMEYIHGEDARTIRIVARKRQEPIPLQHALAIVHGTASALVYAHNKIGPQGPLGLVHRDVSASNVLVSFDGAVKLVDFGIARATSRQTKTRTGTLKGKIPYMSPEQCQNKPLDKRSDLFSLGVVLYELTTGRRPFRGDSDFAILDQIINKGAPAPSSFDPSYPPELERIVMKLLERSAAKRYQAGEELVADLEAVMASRNLWSSPIALGRYMKSLFAEKYSAWEKAAHDGASMGDHVASTVTSESLRAEMRMTPVSAFTAEPGLEDDPSDHEAPADPKAETSVLAPEIVSTPASGPVARPHAPASKRPVWIGLGVGLAAVAVGVVIMMNRSPSKDEAAKPAPPAAATMPSEMPPTPTTTTATVPPATVPPATVPPATVPPATTPPPTTATTMPPPPPETTAPPTTTTTTPPTTATKPRGKTKNAKPKPKDSSWDRNSLFLPE